MATPPGGPQYGGPQPPGYGEQYGPGYGTPPHGHDRPPRRYDVPAQPSSPRRAPWQAPTPYNDPYGPRQAPPQQPYGPAYTPMPEPPRPPQAPPASTNQPLVRPYAMTGGRTRPRYQLAIEALVSTTADPSQAAGLLPEHRRIVQLCREVKSVAEISALLTIPLGVARILVADLAEAGMVAIHQPAGAEDPGAQPDLTLLERVLSGLRKL